jgi:hypothetical protein
MSEAHILDLDELTVSEAAPQQMAATADPRLKEIGDAAVRHAFVREVNLAPAEWLTGIGFLTEIGKACRTMKPGHRDNETDFGTRRLDPFFRELSLGACFVRKLHCTADHDLQPGN